MDGKDDKNAEQPEAAGWQYSSSSGPTDTYEVPDDAADIAGSDDTGDSVEWSASEFVAHEKNVGWYAALLLLTALIAVGLYFVTKDVFSVGVVVILAIVMAIAAARKPRVVQYRLDGSGITIGKTHHSYNEYKSFVMPEQGPFASIVLIPMKRFGFPLSAYLAPDSQDKVLNVLSSHLPLENGRLDGIEQLMRQLRF